MMMIPRVLVIVTATVLLRIYILSRCVLLQ
jgi:hypothetical protein